MRIRLLAFAAAADALGAGEVEIELPAPCGMDELRSILGERYPGLGPLWPRLAVAIDGRVVGEDSLVGDGSEVALLPPVSGGSPGSHLQDEPLRVEEVLASVAAPDCGAVVLFLGLVRNEHCARPVEKLTYSAYRTMAERSLEEICSDLESQHSALRAAIVHRTGELEVGEVSVIIATASPHRETAYRANRQALERLKRETPIWKKERYANGTDAWREEERIGPRAEDCDADGEEHRAR